MKLKKISIFTAVKIGYGLLKLLKKSLEDGKITYNEGIGILLYVAKSVGLNLDSGFKVK